jgi:SAM-dependent methyltransferase
MNVDLLRPGCRVLDLACGAGRNALPLALAGFSVTAMDRDPEKVGALRAIAERLDVPLRVEAVDLEREGVDLGADSTDAVLVIHYLHRPLFSALARALAPGGVLLYETFTSEQARHGKPTNPDYLLQPGELPSLVSPLELLRQREGEFEGRCVAAVAASKS